MKLRLNHIAFRPAAAALAIILAMALAACSSRGGAEEPEMPATEYRAGFYVTVGDEAPVASSRTPSDGPYLPGDGLENYIDIERGDIRVVLFNPDKTLLTEITDLQITPVATYGSSKRYYINGATKTDISAGSFKVMVLANWRGNYPAEWSLDNVWNTTYTFNGTGKLSKETGDLIPLYAIKDVHIDGGIRPDQAADLGTIHMLRAMAKIEVIFADDFWTVKSLRLSSHNTTGFCAPHGVDSQDKYVHASWADDYTSASIPAGAEQGAPIDFVKTDGTHWILYVPEYYNTRSSCPEATIEMVFNEGLSDTKTIRFLDKSVTPARTRDILRNYWYRFRVTKKDENSEINVEVDVKPYHEVELDPSFGLDTDD